jgi:flagellar basal body rod protein FlgG
MDIGAHIAASGAILNQKMLEQVTHNLSNASTPGFKKRMMQAEAFPFSLQRDGSMASDSLAFVQGRPPVSSREQGMVEQTGRALDLAIEGKGYFQARTPQGIRPVRDGRLRLAPDGTIVTREGHPVQNDSGGSMQVDLRKKTEISPDGEVRSGERRIGRLMIADEGGRPLDPTTYRIAQGHLEMSNVNAIEEMVKMLELVRNHGSYVKLMKSFDELEGKTVQELGRL